MQKTRLPLVMLLVLAALALLSGCAGTAPTPTQAMREAEEQVPAQPVVLTATPKPTETPTPEPTATPTPTPTPTPEATPTPDAGILLRQTMEQWIQEERRVETQEVFDLFKNGDELEFYNHIIGARFYLGNLLDKMGILAEIARLNAWGRVGVAIHTTFTPTKRSFSGGIGYFEVQFCGWFENTQYLPLQLTPADEASQEILDPQELGAQGYYTSSVDMTWYGNVGPFQPGGRRYDYPGHQTFVFFDRENGQILGTLETETVFDEELYWNDFKKRGRGLWMPYVYKGVFRNSTEDEQTWAHRCWQQNTK